jgi:hypothetical protein
MSRGPSQVEVGHRTSRKGRIEKNDSVILGVGRVVGREGSVTEETLAITGGETDGVEVERTGGSNSESFLHGGLLGGIWGGPVEPAGAQGPGGVRQLEAETSSAIVFIQDIDLRLDLRISGMDDRNKKRDKRISQATYGT